MQPGSPAPCLTTTYRPDVVPGAPRLRSDRSHGTSRSTGRRCHPEGAVDRLRPRSASAAPRPQAGRIRPDPAPLPFAAIQPTACWARLPSQNRGFRARRAREHRGWRLRFMGPAIVRCRGFHVKRLPGDPEHAGLDEHSTAGRFSVSSATACAPASSTRPNHLVRVALPEPCRSRPARASVASPESRPAAPSQSAPSLSRAAPGTNVRLPRECADIGPPGRRRTACGPISARGTYLGARVARVRTPPAGVHAPSRSGTSRGLGPLPSDPEITPLPQETAGARRGPNGKRGGVRCTRWCTRSHRSTRPRSAGSDPRLAPSRHHAGATSRTPSAWARPVLQWVGASWTPTAPGASRTPTRVRHTFRPNRARCVPHPNRVGHVPSLVASEDFPFPGPDSRSGHRRPPDPCPARPGLGPRQPTGTASRSPALHLGQRGSR